MADTRDELEASVKVRFARIAADPSSEPTTHRQRKRGQGLHTQPFPALVRAIEGLGQRAASYPVKTDYLEAFPTDS